MKAADTSENTRTAVGRLNNGAWPHLEDEFVVYTHEALATTLQVSPEELDRHITAAPLKREQRNGSWFIRKSDSRAFFSQFLQLPPGVPTAHEVPRYLRQLNTPWAQTLVSMYEDPINYPAALPANQGEFLRALVLNTKPEHIVEIGCFTGISTIWMASALEELGGGGRITAIDLFEDVCPNPPKLCESLARPIEYVCNSLGAAGLPHLVDLVRANSHDFGPRYGTAVGKTIDLLYIDGDHTRAGALKDFHLYAPHVKVGGYVVLHDIHPQSSGHKGPRFIIEQFVRHSRDYEMVEINTTPLNFGIAVMRKLGSGVPSRFSVRLAEIARNVRSWSTARR